MAPASESILFPYSSDNGRPAISKRLMVALFSDKGIIEFHVMPIDAINASVSSAKIACPGSDGIFLRVRLFDALERARQKPVVWLAAPAGSGKTTLISSYATACRMPCLWYQLDEGDGDPATFFYYLYRAAQNETQPHILPLAPLKPEYLPSLSVFARRFFEQLCACLKPPHILVLDNYQEIPADSPMHELIAQGLAAIPKGISVMILSRTDPPPSFARLRANSSIKMITWNEIRLSPDETRSIIRSKGHNRLTSGNMQALHEKCEGWPAGLILMLELLKYHDIDQIQFWEEAILQDIFDYFAGEVFEHIDTATQAFLLKTAFLPKIHADTAHQITGIAHSKQILVTMVRNQYFTTKSAGNESIYQYHQLFRQFLTDRAKHLLSAKEIIEIQRAGSALLADKGQIEDAAGLLLNIQDWPALIGLILNHAPALASQGRSKTLQAWIHGIPEHHRETNPWLLYWLGMSGLPFDLCAGRSFLQQGFEKFKVQNDPEGIYLCWSGIVESYIYEWGDMAPLDYWIAEIETLLRIYPQFPSPEIEAKVSSAIFSAMMFRKPDHARMAYWENRLKAIILGTTDIQLKIIMSNPLILYYTLWIGRLGKAAFLVNELRKAISTRPVEPLQYIIWRSMDGAYLWMTNRFEESYQAMQEGLSAAEKSGIHVWDFIILSNMMLYWRLWRGRTDKASEILEKLSYIHSTHRKIDIAHYYYLCAYNALCQDNPALAFEHISAAIKLVEEAGVPFVYNYFKTGLADVLIELGEYDQAARHLHESSRYGQRMKSRSLESQCSWLWAVLYFKKKRDGTAFKHLRGYLQNIRKYGTGNHGWWRAGTMSKLYAKALEAGIETRQVQKLIREYGIRPSPACLSLEDWPYPLKIYTLGRFTLKVDDKPLSVMIKGQKKPIELLKALIAFGSHDIKDEQLSDALWPDADGQNAHKAFTTTLHRLRKIIGCEHAIILKGRKVSLNPDFCWVDTWLLQCFLEEARQLTAKPAAPLKDVQRTAGQILACYKGHFLDGDEDPWVLGPRERLWLKVRQVVRRIGSSLEDGAHWAAAVEFYQQWLLIDSLSEELYRGLMRCQARSGNPSQALDTYRRCRRTLKSVLGVDPSPETEKMRIKFIP